MIIDAISNGIVIDHISAGKAMELYNILGLDKLDCSVALLKNVSSGKLGRKDIIKIDRVLDLDWDVIGYVDPGITVNIIKDGKLAEKRQLKLPERITNVIRCKNPRGTGASAGIHADRPGDTHIPLPVLRDQGRKVKSQKRGNLKGSLFFILVTSGLRPRPCRSRGALRWPLSG